MEWDGPDDTGRYSWTNWRVGRKTDTLERKHDEVGSYNKDLCVKSRDGWIWIRRVGTNK